MYWRTVWEQIASGGFMLQYMPHDFIHGLAKPLVFGGIISTSAATSGSRHPAEPRESVLPLPEPLSRRAF